MTRDDTPSPREEGEEEKAVFTGEENTGERSTPRKDLVAAGFLSLFSLVAMYYAWQLEIPDSIFTAPGLLPFLTGLSLLAMAMGLAIRAVRQGATDNFFDGSNAIIATFLSDDENRRTLLLMGIIFVWVMIVGQINMDLRWPTAIHVFRFSGYEAVSIPMLALILRLFWRASVAKCFAVSALTIFALASAFRDGFKILLPEAG